ncbi:putative nuclease HARBI1 [Pecten maximus]|uniref:putative nuclease HARBI1 n=1 Tax=Pecten maximus TaxID=6579 RepID=UPI0014580AB7|nr:putative nuclease HARBI1 [Pecten maximus]
MAIAYALRRRRMRRDCRRFRPRFRLNSFCDREYRERYRFSFQSILFILNLIRPKLETATTRSKAISPILQLLVALRFYATGSFFRLIGDSVGLSEASVCRCVHKVSAAIARLARRFITFTDDVNTKQHFYKLSSKYPQLFLVRSWRFPNVVGCLDCTHVRIQGPTENEKDFVNRKGFHSLNVQNKKMPRSTTNSDPALYILLSGTYDGLLLGDSGYPCRHFLMTPFINPSTNEQQRFNNSLCRTRTTIEQTFGILKRRFACLSVGLRVAPTKAAGIIMACVVLHNIAQEKKEVLNCEHQNNYNEVGNQLNYVGPDAGGAGVRNHICQNNFR